jgi:signal transduction histidine kinase
MAVSEDAASAGPAVASVDDVIVTHELFAHPVPPPDHAAETAALLALSRTLSKNPDAVAQDLVEAAVRLTRAHSAGLSLAETFGGERIFRWVATTGEYARYLHGTMPRDFSPCGTVLERRQPLLMKEPVRFYSYVSQLHAPPHRVLLVPFGLEDDLIGTVWVVAHDDSKLFTAEDLRIVQSLAAFASAVSATVGLLGNLRAREQVNAQLLAASQENLRRMGEMFQQAPGFVAVLRGPDFVLELANDAYLDITGRRDIVGRPLFEAMPEFRDQGFEQLLQLVTEGRQAYMGRDVRLLVPSASGELRERYVDFIYQPILEPDGSVSGIFVQGHDVTARLLATEALKEADRRKDEFISVLAHELRNPLSPIRLSAQVLKRLPGASDPRQQQAVAIIENQTGFITRLVEDLCELSRIRAGKLHLKLGPVSLQDVVSAALETLQPLLGEREQRLVLRMPPAPVRVQGDRDRLVQVASNLLNNASKYSHRGAQVSVTVAEEDGRAVLRVADNGNGIEPAMLPHIFDMFVQASRSYQQRQGGLGIGLALVQQLTALHGGRVEAASDGPGRGATFTVRLPLLSNP